MTIKNYLTIPSFRENYTMPELLLINSGDSKIKDIWDIVTVPLK
jgi:hypothetical protein